MPSFVATQADTVTCGHAPGKVGTVGSPKLTVGGKPVLVATGVVGKLVTGCGTVVDPNTGTKLCTLVVSLTPPSLSTKLQVGGAPVVLSTLGGTTDGTVGGVLQSLVSVTVQQTRLKTD